MFTVIDRTGVIEVHCQNKLFATIYILDTGFKVNYDDEGTLFPDKASAIAGLRKQVSKNLLWAFDQPKRRT